MMNIMAMYSSDTLVNLHQTVRRHVPDDSYQFGIDMRFKDLDSGFIAYKLKVVMSIS
jgi:hypothetical protein